MGADAVDRGVKVHVRPLSKLPPSRIARQNTRSNQEIDADSMFYDFSESWNTVPKKQRNPDELSDKIT
jgi:hypothetical protein